MTRSFKKHQVYKCKFTGGKQLAARKLRRYRGGITSGCSYKKYYQQYDIIEYVYWHIPSRKEERKRFKELHKLLFRTSLRKFRKQFTWEQACELMKEYKSLLYYKKLFSK